MGSNINWIDERSPFKKEKDYIDSTNTTNGWKTILNIDNFINCNACKVVVSNCFSPLFFRDTSN